jgi:DNA repair photolyase
MKTIFPKSLQHERRKEVREPKLVEEFRNGRGAQADEHNRFEKNEYVDWEIDLPKDLSERKTKYIEVFPKTLVNRVDSPDISFDYSINPYQGCEHGCVYCYARNSHTYWGYNIGLDFESRILYKPEAAKLLKKKLESRNWEASPIMLSGNTDPYQPIEHKLKITRSLLEVFLEYRHPVSIITKNSLILRDLDILKELNRHRLVAVAISITSLNERLRSVLEPKTASGHARMRVVKALSAANIPVNVMMAPIIPSLNSQEIIPLVKMAGESGARKVVPIIVRLNGQLLSVFEKWVRSTFPDRADKVLKQIADAHGGKVNDSRFNTRMKGEGSYVNHIHEQIKLASKLYIRDSAPFEHNRKVFTGKSHSQLRLFPASQTE